MSPSDAAPSPHRPLWLPVRGCRTLARRGASQVPDGSFGARCLLSPRGVRQVHLIEASPPVRASSSLADWPLPCSFNEAEPSSRDATARAFTFPSFSGQDRSRPLEGRLHDSRSLITMNTFQFTRTTTLAWRFPGANGGNRERIGGTSGSQASVASVPSCSTLSLCVLCVLCAIERRTSISDLRTPICESRYPPIPNRGSR